MASDDLQAVDAAHRLLNSMSGWENFEWKTVISWAPVGSNGDVILKTATGWYDIKRSLWDEMVAECGSAVEEIDTLDGCLLINPTTNKLRVLQ